MTSNLGKTGVNVSSILSHILVNKEIVLLIATAFFTLMMTIFLAIPLTGIDRSDAVSALTYGLYGGFILVLCCFVISGDYVLIKGNFANHLVVFIIFQILCLWRWTLQKTKNKGLIHGKKSPKK